MAPTSRPPAGRLRKYVTSENVTTTVQQVQREEVRIERKPITDANIGAAMDGPAISEDDYEVVLHEERPVVEKVERVRPDKDTVTENVTITEEVHKENIKTDRMDHSRR